MKYSIHNHQNILISTLCIAIIVALGVSLGNPASAAPPYSVGYSGTPTTAAVPGKAVKLNFEVTNTGTTVYSGVKVILHIPEGITHSQVAPANSSIVDDTITWMDVPINTGGSFYPSLTVTLDSGTPLKTKKNIWVQVTGENMEENSQNFSLTAVATATTTTKTTSSSSSLIPKINAIHRLAYDRNPSTSEHVYWLGRVTAGDKTTYEALLGAMQFHVQQNIAH